ncbi:flagellar hook assembly protein FlgD [Bacillus andreraoultii]|uniref:flagellar hook assembly protein FlgD n=1 Tax=Bacillus andreraoultii TaxID=1499685 RepID=UPI00053B2BE2|nr:flagellar hook assembly protein FlgD [Bacillus andreraoultii]
MTNTIDSSYYLSNAKKETQSTNTNTLGKDAFLKLLITQLQNQDPLNPMQDKEFISQMATFSQLEQAISMGESIKELVNVQKEQQLFSYHSLLGKEVHWDRITPSENEKEKPLIESGKGVISLIKFTEDGVKFFLQDGTELTAGNISEVSSKSSENPIANASYVIGKKVGWEDNGIVKSGVVNSITQKDGIIYYQVNDENQTKLTNNQIISIELA